MKKIYMAVITLAAIAAVGGYAYAETDYSWLVPEPVNQVLIIGHTLMYWTGPASMTHGLNVTGGLTADTFSGVCTNCSCTTNLTGDVNLTGTLAVLGNVGQVYYGSDNVRLGVSDSTPRIVFENADSADNAWVIDNGGAGLRFYKQGISGIVPLRVNHSGVQLGSNGKRSDMWVWGDITTYDPAGGKGNVNVDGYLNVTGVSLTNSIYGGMYNYSAAGLAIGIASSEVYYNITNLKQDSTNGVTFLTGTQAAGGSRMIVGYAGMYQLSATLAASCGLNGEYGFGITKNYINPETVGNCYSRLTGTGNVRPTSVTCLMQLAVGDTVSMAMDDEKNPSQDCTVQTVNMVMVRVGS